MSFMSARKVKARKSPEIDQARKNFIRTFSERIEPRLEHRDKGQAAAEIGCSADTITNWLQTTLPDIFEAQRFADFLGVRPAWLSFGELPEDRASDLLVTLIADGLNRASKDTRCAALRVLGIEPDSIPPGTVIQVHSDGVKTYEPPDHGIQLPVAKAQEDPAPYAGALDQETMHRLCDDLCARMVQPDLALSAEDAALYRRIAAVIQSVIEHLPTGPTLPTPPVEPSAEDGTTPGGGPLVSDDDSADDGATS
jgi:hypothetical protein